VEHDGAHRDQPCDGRDPFRILIGCLLSLRTKDETTGPASAGSSRWRIRPEGILALPTSEIERAIYPVGFYRTKARVLHRVCRDLHRRFDGRVPSDLDALSRSTGRPEDREPGRDVRIRALRASASTRTCTASRTDSDSFGRRRPRHGDGASPPAAPRHWIGLNDLLVAFGQNLCHPTSPHCTTCPVASACARVGVRQHR
jgi:endonuclease-3